MKPSVRGTAYVNVMWVVVLVVLLFASGGFAYVLMDQSSAKDLTIASQVDRIASLTDQNVATADRVIKVSEAIGFRDAGSQEPYSRPDEIKGRIQALNENYDFIGDDATSLDRVVEALVANNDSLSLRVAELEQQRRTAEQSRESLEQQMRDVGTQKDQAHSELESTLQDERARAQANEQRDSDQIENLRREVEEARSRERATKEESERQVAQVTGEIRVLQARLDEMTRKLQWVRNPEEPDGSILAVSRVGTCSIDRGRADLLRNGTRFTAFRYGKSGTRHPKGLIEVCKVGENAAEANVIETYDDLDPIAPGDHISAPMYDPEMPREFVLVGRFPTGYTRAAVADRLRSLGAKVAEQVTPSTDFLIVGESEPAADAESGEGGSGDLTETEAYRLAQVYKVQTLPVREILDFLRYD